MSVAIVLFCALFLLVIADGVISGFEGPKKNSDLDNDWPPEF